MSERACTAHAHDPYEAEPVTLNGLSYIQLRCPVCDRPQGLRLVRRKRNAVARLIEAAAEYDRTDEIGLS